MRSVRLWLGVGAGGSVGVLPSPDVGLFVASRLEPLRSRWSFEWRGAYHLPERVRNRSVSGVFSAIEQRLLACISPFRWPIARFDVCGGVTWMAVIPQIGGTAKGNESFRAVTGPTFTLAFQVGERPLAGRLELGVALPFRRYTFVYRDPEDDKNPSIRRGRCSFFLSLGGLRTIS